MVRSTVALLLAATLVSEQRPLDPNQIIAASSDPLWLEQVVLSPEEAGLIGRRGLAENTRDLRTHAYARLGELATPESVAAIERVETRLSQPVDIRPMPYVPGAPIIHWSLHMGDAEMPALEKTTLSDARDGRQFAIVGGMGSYVTVADRTSGRPNWSRPVPAVRIDDQLSRYTNLTWRGRDTLGLSYELYQPTPQPPEKWPTPRVKTVSFRAADVYRDDDADGWTNVAEQLLGLNPNKRDSDGDGLSDSRDACPTFRMPSSLTNADREDREIVRRALFAVLVLSGSKLGILVDAGSIPVQLDGYGGPIRFDIRPQNLYSRSHFVRWDITRWGSDFADVDINDGNGGQVVLLRKLNHRWFVFARLTTWVA